MYHACASIEKKIFKKLNLIDINTKKKINISIEVIITLFIVNPKFRRVKTGEPESSGAYLSQMRIDVSRSVVRRISKRMDVCEYYAGVLCGCVLLRSVKYRRVDQSWLSRLQRISSTKSSPRPLAAHHPVSKNNAKCYRLYSLFPVEHCHFVNNSDKGLK